MKNYFSCFKLIADIKIYKIRVIISKKSLITNENHLNLSKNLEKHTLFSYTKIIENAA